MEDEIVLNVKRITPQSKASSQRRLVRRYCKNSRRNLGLSKTKLDLFISQTNNICKRDIILVLRKIKFNEPFDVLGHNFSMAASTAYYIFKRRVKQLADQMARFIDWHDESTIYKEFNPLGASEHLMSMVDHLVIDLKRKYFISCAAFGMINFLSKGYPYKMSNHKILEQSNFLRELPGNAEVMVSKKYRFMAKMIYQSCFFIWEEFKETLLINQHPVALANELRQKPMILQVKKKLRNFKILSESNLDKKILPILDEVMVICGALCNLRKDWCEFFQCEEVGGEVYEEIAREENEAVDHEEYGEEYQVEYEEVYEDIYEDEVVEEEYGEEYEQVYEEEVGDEVYEEVGEDEYGEEYQDEYEDDFEAVEEEVVEEEYEQVYEEEVGDEVYKEVGEEEYGEEYQNEYEDDFEAVYEEEVVEEEYEGEYEQVYEEEIGDGQYEVEYEQVRQSEGFEDSEEITRYEGFEEGEVGHEYEGDLDDGIETQEEECYDSNDISLNLITL